MINKYYFISEFDTNNINKLDKQTAIIFRDYTSEKVNESPGIKEYDGNRNCLGLRLVDISVGSDNPPLELTDHSKFIITFIYRTTTRLNISISI